MAAMEAFVEGAMANPDVLAAGALLGFLIGKIMSRRKRRGMGMGGGGMF